MSVGQIEERDDRPAYVRFERRAVEDKAASLVAGRSVSKDMDFALITPPYSKDLHEAKVDTWLENVKLNVKSGKVPKAHFESWQRAYQAFRDGEEAPLDGTPIREWSAISPAQIKNLIALHILTIEDLADVNDQGLSRIGMGAQELKKKAVNWLSAATDHGPLTLKVTQLEIDNARLMSSNEDLIAKNTALMAQLSALSQPIHAVEVERKVEGIALSDIIDTEQTAPVTVSPSLSEQYEAKFGKKPHHLMKDATIEKKLLE